MISIVIWYLFLKKKCEPWPRVGAGVADSPASESANRIPEKIESGFVTRRPVVMTRACVWLHLLEAVWIKGILQGTNEKAADGEIRVCVCVCLASVLMAACCNRISRCRIRLGFRSISSGPPVNTSSSSPSPSPAAALSHAGKWHFISLLSRRGPNAYSIALHVISHKDTLLIPAPLSPPPPLPELKEKGCQHSGARPRPGPWRIKGKLNLTAVNATAIYMQSLRGGGDLILKFPVFFFFWSHMFIES